MCSTRSSNVSTCPYMIVAEPGIPTSWAVLTVSIHSLTLTFSGHIISRDLSVNISAAVPGKVSSPADFNLSQASAISIPDKTAASLIIVGENP